MTKANETSLEAVNANDLVSEAVSLANNGMLKEAESLCLKILEDYPENADSLHVLGVIASWTGNNEIGVYYLLEATKINSNQSKYFFNLGVCLFNLRRYEDAISAFETAIQLDPDQPWAYARLGIVHRLTRSWELAEQSLKKSIDLGLTDVQFIPLYTELGMALQSQNKINEALHYFELAYQINPLNIWSFIAKELLLPILYQDEEEIHYFRQRYKSGLINIVESLNLEDDYVKRVLIDILSSYISHQFYLPYQGFNDYDLQKMYGQFLFQLISQSFTSYSSRVLMPAIEADEKLRIGYISSSFYSHTVAKLTKGWIASHDKTKFDIYCYYALHESNKDQYTQAFIDNSEVFVEQPIPPLDALARKIKEDNLHILVYLEIGMRPPLSLLAAMRLAPVQCVFWGHPQTTGLPTIDYFLSSELMESGEGNFYTEKLVLLPNISICYDKPILPELDKSRTDFDLNHESIIYLCCQSNFKYLPQYDILFARIAQRVENSFFVFLSSGCSHIDQQFSQRLSKAFSSLLLDWDHHCVILPRLSFSDYLKINMLSDVYLDTIGWSGGNTTLEAIACGLPIVTCPGSVMRSCHSYGILKMLGIVETVASNTHEYVDIAVRLGIDAEYRQDLSSRIVAAHDQLYSDKTCVRALEQFYEEAVKLYSKS